jgi:hypothetical protein
MSNKEYFIIIVQMLKRIHKREFYKKIYTYVKTLSEMQGD